MKTLTEFTKKPLLHAGIRVFILAILISEIGLTIQAQTIDSKTDSPYFLIKGEEKENKILPLRSTSATIHIAGVIAAVKITQEYCNTGSAPIEALYVFPASSRAAVYGLKMIIGDRIICAKINEREKARQEYEQAKQEGKSASLLEQQRPNVFQMNVANIIPGDTIKVELFYTELLKPENGVYEFSFPTVVGPRYSNPGTAIASSGFNWITNPYLKEGVVPTYNFNFELTLNSAIPIKDAVCNTHQVDIKYSSKNKAEIHLKETEKNGGNRDFILHYRLAGDKIESGVLCYEGKNENYFLAMIEPPVRVNSSFIPPREYIFIVDVSGSMYGFPLDISKKLLRELMANLRPEDKLNIVLFAGSASILSESGSIPANKENVDRAIQLIEKQQGGGGTELLNAIKKAMAIPGDENFSRSFIIATDGYVSVEKETFDYISKNLNKANFFAFGIGSAVNRYIIEGIARTGKAESFVITDPAIAVEQANRFREYIQSPVLSKINVSYHGIDVYDQEPITIPDVLADRPIIIIGKYKGNSKGELQLKGLSGEKEINIKMDLATASVSDENTALRYLWAREKIARLDDFSQLDNSDKLKKEITDLGLNYNLLTAYTSFVAVDENVRNKSAQLQTIVQPLPLPKGVSEYAVGGVNSLSTATPNSGYFKRKILGNQNGSPKQTNNPINGIQEQKTEDLTTSDTSENKPVVKTEPEFKGGEMKLQEYILKNLLYPEFAQNNHIEGIVTIKFTISAKGKIRNIKVMKGVIKEIDVEAIRLIKAMPEWIPAYVDGVPVEKEYTIKIDFKI